MATGLSVGPGGDWRVADLAVAQFGDEHLQLRGETLFFDGGVAVLLLGLLHVGRHLFGVLIGPFQFFAQPRRLGVAGSVRLQSSSSDRNPSVN